MNYEDLISLLGIENATSRQLPDGRFEHTFEGKDQPLPTHIDRRFYDALFKLTPAQSQELYDAVMSFFPREHKV